MYVKKMTVLSLYTAVALILFVVESAIPMPVPLPFVKLGLANIITLIVLVCYSPKDAFLVLMLRIFLASVFYGQIVYLVYSMAGGILCFLADVVINRLLKGKYIYITAVFGALFHNAGQMLAAFFFLGKGVLPYFPYMVLCGIITGLFTGILANILVLRLKRLNL